MNCKLIDCLSFMERMDCFTFSEGDAFVLITSLCSSNHTDFKSSWWVKFHSETEQIWANQNWLMSTKFLQICVLEGGQIQFTMEFPHIIWYQKVLLGTQNTATASIFMKNWNQGSKSKISNQEIQIYKVWIMEVQL